MLRWVCDSSVCMKAPLAKNYTPSQHEECNVGLTVAYNTVANNIISFNIFIRLAIVGSQNCEIPRNSLKIRTYSSSMSTKVTYLCVNRKSIYNFLLVINSTFGLSKFWTYLLQILRYWRLKLENGSYFSHPFLDWRSRSEGTGKNFYM